ncbi:DUF2089 domain-containing protein [Fimbriimonas ginsengisoli]|uniref:DUF2089 domain-containing protein n=1 Tax=Fimbriimonas ginsengisoli Gsoil 348 TaxID=661478 RepID=A0A068NXM7_FIMGI|nr:DUF2089 domain-containing protein [Fimbriimonas ginsengisoli]AIE87510.1 hypothetical protein OP10G_4142 [Fimbriimonas ginsengisoli Gsoil 348]
MSKDKYHPIPARDPVSGGDLYISELANEDSGITIRGKFEVPRYARLDPEQQRFLETFLRCRGMLNSVERELKMSYPTVRARLDSLLESLDLTPMREETGRKDKNGDKKRKVLDQLEKGEITAEEAKSKLGVLK